MTLKMQKSNKPIHTVNREFLADLVAHLLGPKGTKPNDFNLCIARGLMRGAEIRVQREDFDGAAAACTAAAAHWDDAGLPGMACEARSLAATYLCLAHTATVKGGV